MKVDRRTHPLARRQRGAVLIVGLILLMVMTLIGVTAMKLTTLDERIAGNAQVRVGTFQAAESALAETADYDTVLKCSQAGCDCLPGSIPAERIDACKGNGYLKLTNYVVGKAQPPGGDKLSLDATAGMKYRGDVSIFGNSIGVATTVAGRLVEVRAVAGERSDTGAKADHRLLVAPVGLRRQ